VESGLSSTPPGAAATRPAHRHDHVTGVDRTAGADGYVYALTGIYV
jgi:hypothetical protein